MHQTYGKGRWMIRATGRWGRSLARRAVRRKPSGMVTVRVFPDELDGGYVSEIVDMPGIMSQGDTPQEAVENIIEALTEVWADQLAQQFRDSPTIDPKTRQTAPLTVCLAPA